MKMDVQNRLPGIGIRVRNNPEAAFIKTPLFCQCRSDPEKMPDHQVIFRQQIKRISNVLSRYQQQMKRCSRIDILYRYQMLILIDHPGWNLVSDDPAEKTRHIQAS
jgi:hypothetical protein